MMTRINLAIWTTGSFIWWFGFLRWGSVLDFWCATIYTGVTLGFWCEWWLWKGRQ